MRASLDVVLPGDQKSLPKWFADFKAAAEARLPLNGRRGGWRPAWRRSGTFDPCAPALEASSEVAVWWPEQAPALP